MSADFPPRYHDLQAYFIQAKRSDCGQPPTHLWFFFSLFLYLYVMCERFIILK